MSIAILAIAVRAIVPAGYMFDRDGAVAVRLCSDHGFQNATINLKTGAIVLADHNAPSGAPDDNAKKKPLCPYGGQPGPVAAASPPQFDAPHFAALEAGKVARVERRAHNWTERPWPTGPPQYS